MIAAALTSTIAVTAAEAEPGRVREDPPDWVADLEAQGDVELAPSPEPEAIPLAQPAPPPAAEPSPASFPEPGAWEVALAGEGSADAAPAEPDPEAGRPIVLRPVGNVPTRGPSAGVEVEVLDRAAAERAGARGVVFTVEPTQGRSLGDLARQAGRGGAALPVEVEIDYSSFAGAYGGGYGDRLQLVALPACALAWPRPEGCNTAGVRLPVRNDIEQDRLIADVEDLAALTATMLAGQPPAPELVAAAGGLGAAGAPEDMVGADPIDPAAEGHLPPEGLAAHGSSPATDDDGMVDAVAAPDGSTQVGGDAVVFAVTSGVGGETGTYAASPLSSTGSWQVSPGSGEFTYGYPINIPAPAGGTAPSVGLSYSSSSVDGLTNATNTQAPQTGIGWSDFANAFIERRYEPCVVVAPQTNDLCWESYNGTISLNGVAGQLIPVDSQNRQWRLQNDPGWLVERIGDAGVTFEYWKVTAQDGTQYFFGGGAMVSGKETGSQNWVPVFADHAGEPCWNGFNACPYMPWRWSLDYVVDPNGNTTTYFYDRDESLYAAVNGLFNHSRYVRSSMISKIEYGGRHGQSVEPAGLVTFGWQYRCVTLNSSCTQAPTHESEASDFPDVPTDFLCPAPAPCTITSPAFFSTKRYSNVFVQTRVGMAWKSVAIYNLIHQNLLPGVNPINIQDAKIYLGSIQRVGLLDEHIVPEPSTRFTYEFFANRVDATTGRGQMRHGRLRTVRTSTAGHIGITYGQNRPCAFDYRPEPWDTNIRDCFPQTVFDGGTRRAGVFHKWLVAQVTEDGRRSSTPMVTTYTYEGDPAWAFDYGAFSRYEDRWGWSSWRGYGTVLVTEGTTRTRLAVYRGMDGDPLWGTAGGSPCACVPREATVTSLTGQGTFDDQRVLAGRTLEQVSLGTVGGTADEEVLSTLYGYLTKQVYDVPRELFDVFWAGLGTTTESVATAPNQFRRRSSTTTYTNTAALSPLPPQATMTEESGWLDITGDERCSITQYANNQTAWMWVYPSLNMTAAGACRPVEQIPVASQLRLAETFYDNTTQVGAAPTQGNPTLQRTKIDGTRWSETRTGFDSLGRPVSITDPNGATTTTTFTPSSNLVPTQSVVRNHLGHETTTTFRPELGAATTVVDPNGNRTDMTYDELGRITSVRLPTEQVAGAPVSWKFTYYLSSDSSTPPAVLTEQLTGTSGSNYEASWVIYDGFGRERQTQTQSPVSGRTLVSETRYDNRGLMSEETMPEAVNGAPGTTMLSPASWANTTRMSYDELGRVISSQLLRSSTVTSETTTTYGVDTVLVTGPPGVAGSQGNKVRETIDGLGRTVKVEEYDGSSWVASTMEYNLADDLTAIVDPAGNRITYTYNLAGWRTTQTDPDRGYGELRYNTAGLVTSTRDDLDGEVHTEYDVLGRPKLRRAGSPTGAPLATWTYDTASGGKGQVHTETRHDAMGDWVSTVTGYDQRGRVQGNTTRVPTGVTGLGGEYTVSYGYDRADRLVSTSYPAIGGLAAETVTTTHNNLGLATAITGTDPYVSLVDYDDRSRVTGVALGARPGGVTQLAKHFGYNADLQMESSDFYSITSSEPNGVVARHQLAYDAAGNPTSRTSTLNGQSWRECYRYDRRTRLTDAYTVGATVDCATGTRGSGPQPYNHTYNYSADGRLTSRTEQGTTTNYTYPNAGGPRPHVPTNVGSDIYLWDENGNQVVRQVGGQTATMSWDVEQNLRSISGPNGTTSFVYDADGQRLLRQTPTHRTIYVAGHEVTAANNGTGANAVRAYGFGGTLIATRSTTGGLQYLMTDEAGSVEMAASGAGAVSGSRTYNPYGEVRNEVGAGFQTDRGFLGQIEDDTTDLSYLNARYYDPDVSVFLKADPVYDISNIKTLNPYSYAANNPRTYADPSGTSPSYIFGLEQTNRALRDQNSRLIGHIGKLEGVIADQQNIIRDQQNAITDLLTHIDALEAVIVEQQSVIYKLYTEAQRLVGIVLAQKREIESLRATVRAQAAELFRLRGLLLRFSVFNFGPVGGFALWTQLIGGSNEIPFDQSIQRSLSSRNLELGGQVTDLQSQLDDTKIALDEALATLWIEDYGNQPVEDLLTLALATIELMNATDSYCDSVTVVDWAVTWGDVATRDQFDQIFDRARSCYKHGRHALCCHHPERRWVTDRVVIKQSPAHRAGVVAYGAFAVATASTSFIAGLPGAGLTIVVFCVFLSPAAYRYFTMEVVADQSTLLVRSLRRTRRIARSEIDDFNLESSADDVREERVIFVVMSGSPLLRLDVTAERTASLQSYLAEHGSQLADLRSWLAADGPAA